MKEKIHSGISFSVKKASLEQITVDAIIVGVAQKDKNPLARMKSKAIKNTLEELIKRKEFSGSLKETFAVPPSGKCGARWVIFVGLGKKSECMKEQVRRAAGCAAKVARSMKCKTVGVDCVAEGLPLTREEYVEAFAEGVGLGMYTFSQFKSKKKDAPFLVKEMVVAAGSVDEKETFTTLLAAVSNVVASVNVTRDLANLPANMLTPGDLERASKEVAREFNVKCTTFSRAQLEKMGMNALLAVSRGSHEEPRFIVLEYKHPQATGKTTAFVGKGVTFDSGGISLKPGRNMHEMKFDMCGAAAVLGTIRACAALKLPVHVYGVIGAAENLPGGGATKPGDVVTAYSGTTIEILNTDAEGRLILADALAYTEKELKPDTIIDIATLTGAASVVLGSAGSCIVGTDQGIIDTLLAAGTVTGERLWQLPLWDEHKDAMKSQVADLQNIANKSGGGVITGAAFVGAFVAKTPWAHVDIGATANSNANRPYLPAGASGVGVRLFIEYLKKRI